MKRLGIFISLLTFLLVTTGQVFAQTPPQRGLLITPPRQYLSVEPGKTIQSSLTIANLTDKEQDVRLSVEQFSVANYTYDFKFETAKEDWVKLEQTSLPLKKSESKTIQYTVTAPMNAWPGGHYFTLFASVDLGEQRQIRAATVLYVTAGGELIKESTITQNSLPWLSIGGDIPLAFDVKNTGNTHFLIYISGVLRGLGPTQSSGEAAHLLMPNTTRRVEGKLPGPIIPGVYEVAYGYRNEDGKDIRQSQYILYAPIWTWLFVAGIIWLVVVLIRRRNRLKTSKI